MIFQKDWLMRQIEAMIAAILQFLFHTEELKEQMPPETTSQTETELRTKLDRWLSAGMLCEAEDWFFENMDDSDDMWLRLAVYLYSEMNKMADDFLEEHNFSREEVLEGLTDVCRRFGYGPLLGIQ